MMATFEVMSPLVRFLLPVVLLASAVQGQEQPKLTCRVLFLNGPDSAPDTLHLFDGVGSQPVDLPRMNFSKVYELRPGTRAVSLLPAAVADPEAVPDGAPLVRLPEGTRDFYLLVTSDPANEVAPVELQVINANADRLRRGQMLWFNLTPHLVGGTVGSERLALKPRSSAVLGAPAAGNENYPVNLSYKMADREHLYPLCETTWLHDPRSRSVAFIILQKGIRTPRVWVFPDYREPEEEEGE